MDRVFLREVRLASRLAIHPGGKYDNAKRREERRRRRAGRRRRNQCLEFLRPESRLRRGGHGATVRLVGRVGLGLGPGIRRRERRRRDGGATQMLEENPAAEQLAMKPTT